METTSHKRTLQGIVARKSGEKTIAVAVQRLRTLPPYGKKRTITKNYLVHDPTNRATIGQTVTIIESRPLSRRKRWVLKPE